MADKHTTAKTEKTDTNVARIATIAAGAAIGSAAIAAAVLFATRRRDTGATVSPQTTPDRPSPETD